MAGSNSGAVLLALLGNTVLTVIKFLAFVFSGSGAMLSEAIHSFADAANQGLLFLGIHRSERPADARFHYGYGGDRFFYALMSAIGIFVLGCGVTVYHGVQSLLSPPELHFSKLTFIVLGIALLVDGVVFYAALREVGRRKGKQSLWKYVRTSTDPTLLAVLFEDFIASLGVIVALVGILLAQYTGNPFFDSLSSIVIGFLLGLMAVWLGWRNRELLLGPAIPKARQDEIVKLLEDQPSVRKVRLVRTRIVGAEKFRLAVEVDFDGAHLGEQQSEVLEQFGIESERAKEIARAFGEKLIDSVGDEVDRIESYLSEKVPKVKHIDIEPD